MKELRLDAIPENLDKVLDFVNAELEFIGCTSKTQNQISIAVEEVFINIANYAYNPDIGVACVCIVISNNEVKLVFEDSGKPYNPLEKADPNINESTEDRPIGGLGIFMVKKIMDTVSYQYENGINKLTVTKVIR